MAKKPEENADLAIDPAWEPPVDATADAPPPPLAPETPDPILELKAQLESERAARADAERRANEAAKTAHQAQIETADNQMQLVNTAIDRVKEQSVHLKASYVEALRDGNFEAAAEIQSDMSTNAAKLLQLENGKAAMEAQPKPKAPEPAPLDPVEALAAQLTPRSAAWVRAHPECARDQKLYQKMLAAHNIAIADGITPDSDEYFQSVEATVFKKAPPAAAADDDADDPMAVAAKAAPARSVAPPAAPVSRGSSSRSIRLTPQEREAAEMSGMTEEAYAAAKADMIRSGRMH